MPTVVGIAGCSTLW